MADTDKRETASSPGNIMCRQDDQDLIVVIGRFVRHQANVDEPAPKGK